MDKRRLFILKFEESLEAVQINDSMPVKEIYNFESFIDRDNFDVHIISYEHQSCKSLVIYNNGRKLTYMSYNAFISLIDLNKNDVVIFWTGYNHTTRIECAENIVKWYNCFKHALKYTEPNVLCTDTRCLVLNPSFFLNNPAFENVISNTNYNELIDTFDELEKSDKVKFRYLTQASNISKFSDIVNANEHALKNCRYHHLPLHILPFNSHSYISHVKRYTTKPVILYYAQNIDFNDSDNLRVRNVIDVLSMKSDRFDMEFIGNYKGDLPTSLEDVIFHRRMSYSTIPDMLRSAYASICLSEKEYEECSLIPNRVTEGIASKTLIMVPSKMNHDPRINLGLNDLQVFENSEDLREKLIQIIDNDKTINVRSLLIENQTLKLDHKNSGINGIFSKNVMVDAITKL